MNILQTIKEQIANFFNVKQTEQDNIVSHEKQVFKELSFYNQELLLKKIDPENEVNLMFDIQFRIDEDKLLDLSAKINSQESFYRKDKQEVLNKLYNDMSILNETLKPLSLLPIKYGIDLVGGAVRDYVLDRHLQINDLDVLVMMISAQPKNKDNLRRVYLLEINWCSEDELNKVGFNDNDPIYSRHNKLAQVCLNRRHDLLSVKVFDRDERLIHVVYGSDILKCLSGIVKTSSPELNYSFDILFTDQIRDGFIYTNDFQICESGICFVDPIKNIEFPEFAEIAHRFYTTINFFEDIHNKTITFNEREKTIEQIEYSFDVHLPRLIDKYPEYTPRVVVSKDENNIFIEKALLKFNLERNLPNQISSKRPKI